MYCKFEHFCDNFIFAKSDERIFAMLKFRNYGIDLPTLVNGRVISPIHEGFIFMKLGICEVPRN